VENQFQQEKSSHLYRNHKIGARHRTKTGVDQGLVQIQDQALLPCVIWMQVRKKTGSLNNFLYRLLHFLFFRLLSRRCFFIGHETAAHDADTVQKGFGASVDIVDPFGQFAILIDMQMRHGAVRMLFPR